MRELNTCEIEEVNGGVAMQGFAALGLAGGVGLAAFGTGWGAVGVGLAFAVSPITVVAMTGLALYGGYQLVSN